METALAVGTTLEQLDTRTLSGVRYESICTRCGGLMVSDFCRELVSSTGDLNFAPKRCVQCGEFVDPVILQNRRLQQESAHGIVGSLIS